MNSDLLKLGTLILLTFFFNGVCMQIITFQFDISPLNEASNGNNFNGEQKLTSTKTCIYL